MPGLLRGIARTAVVAGTATAVSGRVQRRQQGRWAAQDEAAERAAQSPVAYPPPPAPPQQQAPPPDTDRKIAQLKELAGLRDAGVLTDVEFELEKRSILGS